MRRLWPLLLVLAGSVAAPAEEGAFPDPDRFAKAVATFEAADADSLPPAGAILCVGSSSMRGWHRRLAQDLAPLTVVPRGFGGSTMYDVLHYADRVVLAYRPRAVLLYEGDNDVAAGLSPAQILATFEALVSRVRGRLPATRFYVIAVKPSISRWALWPAMAATNRLLRAACDTEDGLTFIDVASPMLNADGEPRGDIFLDDQLHMNDAGYDIWRDAVRPVLVAAEAGHETGAEDGDE